MLPRHLIRALSPRDIKRYIEALEREVAEANTILEACERRSREFDAIERFFADQALPHREREKRKRLARDIQIMRLARRGLDDPSIAA